MQATGIMIDGSHLLFAAVRQSRNKTSVLHLKTQQIDNVNPLYIDPGAEVFVSGLHANDLIIRSRLFSPSRSRKIRQALILQVEAQLHLKSEEIITTSILELSQKRATTFSTTRSALDKHLQLFQNIHIHPERVGAIPVALQSFVQWKNSDTPSYFLIHIGLDTINCIWVEQGQLQKAHALSFGLQNLQKAFRLDSGVLDVDLLRNESFPELTESARLIRCELAKIVHSFQCTRPLFFAGFTSGSAFWTESFSHCISEEKKLFVSSDELRFAIPIGLALEYLTNQKYPIQFRLPHALSSHTWKKLGRTCTLLLGLSFLFCSLFWGIGSWWMDQREKEIVRSLETWATTKDFSLHQELFSVGSDTKALVDQWNRLVEKNAKDYRFIMKAPRVAQFLDWLSHHPLIESFRLSADPVSFDQVRYQLVSYPHLDALDDPYSVKIDLRFKVNSPQHARKFHEMLIQGVGLIDGSREIGWEVLSDGYQASFFLKNE